MRHFALLLLLSLPLLAADTADKKRGALTALPQISNVDGVSKEDLEKYKAAFVKSAQDEAVKNARAKLQDLRARLQYASADERKNLRQEFEALTDEVRKALQAAIAKNDPSLKKDTIEKIGDAIEDNLKAKAKEMNAKTTAKTPTKPFPFGDKPKTDDAKPATADTK